MAVAATVMATTNAANAAAPTAIGPSTTTAPYVLPSASGVSITSLLTVGDSPAGNGYRMVGIPDGLGAYRDGQDVVVYMNQELGSSSGIARLHGEKGAFVTKLTIDPVSGAVKKGEDLITSVNYWDYPANQWSATPVPPAGGSAIKAFARFCSASLAEAGRLLNAASGNGYAGRVFFANEENGDNSRVFGVTDDGVATQLPRLGLASFENHVAAKNTGDRTVIVSTEDGGTNDSQLRVYVGTKQRSGTAVEKAGLTNGTLTVMDVAGRGATTDTQFRAKYGKNTPVPVTFNEIDWTKNGAQQNQQAAAVGLGLSRIEDGEFDPNNRNDFYFVTTAGGGTNKAPGSNDSRNGGGLWRLRFVDVDRPELGGSLTLLLDGTEAPYINMADNLAVDKLGNVLLQEDPGNNPHLGRIIAYRISDGARGVLATFDAEQFRSGVHPAKFLTDDKETSGIIDVSDVWGTPNTYLFDAQIHTSKGLPAGSGAGTVGEFVERGQLLVMHVEDWNSVYTVRDTMPHHGPASEVITADVRAGALTLEVAQQQVSMPTVTLTGGDQVVSAALGAVSVLDGRGTAAGWSLTGRVSDFTSDSGSIVADNLGWQPAAAVVTGTLPAASQGQVVAGPSATPGAGTGLGDSRRLCSSPAGASAGAFECAGALQLGIPGATKAGTYTGVLTLTLV
jgi:hypothetical protein